MTAPWEKAIAEGDGEACLQHFLERIDLASGKVAPGPIRPEELLISSHRSTHPVDIHARFMMSRVIRRTGSESRAVREMRRMRRIGWRLTGTLARLLRARDPERLGRSLFGLDPPRTAYRFRDPDLDHGEAGRRIEALRREASHQDARTETSDGAPYVLLLTGGTGFIGQEILVQAARDPRIREVWLLIRPKQIRDRSTGEILETVSPEARGADLLERLRLPPSAAETAFHFLSGDLEEPLLGLAEDRIHSLGRRVTHLVHCAASVAFDAPFEESFHANVVGSLQALRLASALQEAPDSVFVNAVGVETSYIHGRAYGHRAEEEELAFPERYYNNYYELTKAIASLSSERYMLEHRLRLTQLCPSIVIGDARTGNNRGDTKVVNAPVNLFGKLGLSEASATATGAASWKDRSRAALMARVACVFPADPTAELNLITVDRVAAGILSAIGKPETVGHRIHLANDRRLSTMQIGSIVQEELGVSVSLVDPTLHRTVGLPLVGRVLKRLGWNRAARSLRRMDAVFGGYAEWGQPVHQVGLDVELLGLGPQRPDPAAAFRMLCRHNRFVQRFGRVRAPGELSRREAEWESFLTELEVERGAPASTIPAHEFSALVRTEMPWLLEGDGGSHTSG